VGRSKPKQILKFGACEDSADWVPGAVEQEDFGVRCNLIFQVSHTHDETVILDRRTDTYRSPTPKCNGGTVGVVNGIRKQDLIAGLHQCRQSDAEPAGGAVSDEYFSAWVIAEPIVADKFLCHCLPEMRFALIVGIPSASIAQGLVTRFDDMPRRRSVGLPAH
jgi:hypothetical protein